MITERTLKKWRKEALDETNPKIAGIEVAISIESEVTTSLAYIRELNKRILRMTQELLDQHLMRK